MQNTIAVPGINVNSPSSEEIAMRKTELMYMGWYMKLLEMKEKDFKN